jgi:hypothetical protein
MTYIDDYVDDAARSAVRGLEGDPDQAARSRVLGRSMGVPSPLVNADYENFERRAQEQITEEFVRNSPALSQWINANPLNGTISKGDLGNLHEASEALNRYAKGGDMSWYRRLAAGVVRGIEGGAGTGIESIGTLFGSEELRHVEERMAERRRAQTVEALGEEEAKKVDKATDSLAGKVGFGLGDLLTLLPGAVAGGVGGAAITMGLQQAEALRRQALAEGATEEQAMRMYKVGLVSGTVLGALPFHFLSKPVQMMIGGIPGWTLAKLTQAMRFAPTMVATGRAQDALNQIAAKYIYGHDVKIDTDAENLFAELITMGLVGGAFGRVKPWIDAGKEPPPGLDPIIDKQKAIQAGIDAALLGEAGTKLDATETGKRSQEALAEFIGVHPEGSVGFPFEAIRELYKGKEPSPEDNLLGRLPGFIQQLRAAAANGGTVEVPIQDFLTKVSPEVRRELMDSLELKENGGSSIELKEMVEAAKKEEPKPEEPSTEALAVKRDPFEEGVRAAREATGLQFAEPTGAAASPHEFHLGPPAQVRVQGVMRMFPSIGSTTVGQAVKSIPQAKLPLIFAGFTTKEAAGIVRRASSVPLHVVADDVFEKNLATGTNKESMAYYDPIFDNIIMRQSVYGTPFGTYALAHEGMHAATMRAMKQDIGLQARVRMLIDFIEKKMPGIEKEYGMTNHDEFVAETFSNERFRSLLAKIKLDDPALIKELGIEKPTVWDAVIKIISDILGVRTSALDAAIRLGAEAAEVRLTPESRKFWAEKKAAELRIAGMQQELAEMGPKGVIDPSIAPKMAMFERGAIGLNKEEMAKITDLVEKRSLEDAAKLEKRRVERIKKEARKDWKENFKKNQAEAQEELTNRADIAALIYMRTGELYGQKLKRVRLNTNMLTPEEAALLPDDLKSKTGEDPDVLANLFKYDSASDLIQDIGALENAREGKGIRDFVQDLVNQEAQRRTEEAFAPKRQALLDEIEDHITGKTQLDMLHELTLMRAAKAGIKTPITKESMKRFAHEIVSESTAKAVTATRFFKDAGKAYRKMVAALLAEKPLEALRWQQAQYLSTLMAREAAAHEKIAEQADRRFKQFRADIVESTDQNFTNAIHWIMLKVGKPVNTPSVVESSMEASGFPTLKDFADKMASLQLNLKVPLFLHETKQFEMDRLTAGQYKAVADSVEAMAKVGRAVKTIEKEGEALSLDNIMNDLNALVKEIGDKPIKELDHLGKQRRLRYAIKAYGWSHINLASITKRIDRGARGLATRLLMDPLAEADSYDGTKLRQFQKRLTEIAGDLTPRYLNKKIPNDLFMDPQTGNPLPWTRRNLLAVLANIGNKSNIEKLARGHDILDANGEPDEARIIKYLEDNTSKRDWQRQQAIGGLFNELFEEIENMEHHLYGIYPEKIELTGVHSPKYGSFPGWYHPIDYSQQLGADVSQRLATYNGLIQTNWASFGMPTKYLTPRTKYMAPLELNLDIIPVRMRQMIRDIAYREAIINVSKIVRDTTNTIGGKANRFKAMLDRHYGEHIFRQFDEMLLDITNNTNFNSESQAIFSYYGTKLMQNGVGTLIGYNLHTTGKHGITAGFNSLAQLWADHGAGAMVKFIGELSYNVGMLPFRTLHGLGVGSVNLPTRIAAKLWSQELNKFLLRNEETMDSHWNFVMKNSEVVRNRMQSIAEGLGVPAEIALRKGGLRETLLLLGARPVAFLDLLSTVPTWKVTYDIINGHEFTKLIDEGSSITDATEMAHGEAIRAADQAVKEAHGSAMKTFKPSIMRGGPMKQSFAQLYGFFNHMLQKQYEMAWRTKEFKKAVGRRDPKDAYDQLSRVALGLVAYVLIPATVEEMITPYTNAERDSWGVMAAKALTRELSASWVWAREIVQAIIGGHPSAPGIWTGIVKPIGDVYNDISKANRWSQDKDLVGKTLRDFFTINGMATGMTTAPMGRAAEWLYRYSHGMEHPKGFLWDPKHWVPFKGDTFMRGLIEGRLHPPHG